MVEQFFVDCADNAGNRAVYIGNSFYRFNVAESSANLNLVAFLRQVYEYQVAQLVLRVVGQTDAVAAVAHVLYPFVRFCIKKIGWIAHSKSPP